MVKSIYNMLIFIFLFAVISSCEAKNQSRQDKAFLEMFPSVEMNTKIRFWDPKSSESPRIGKILDLSLENYSQDKIVFPGDYGIKILVYDDRLKSWEEIGNDVTYFPSGNPQVSPKGTDLPGVIGISIYPMVTDEGKPIDIRVVVVGWIARNGTPTNEKVGAWVDVTLHP